MNLFVLGPETITLKNPIYSLGVFLTRLFVSIIMSVLHYLKKRESRNRPRRTHRVSGVIAQLFLNLGTRTGCVVSITHRQPLPLGKTRYALYRRLGGPRSRSGYVRKISPHRDSIPGLSRP
jgi:hypothetical protein